MISPLTRAIVAMAAAGLVLSPWLLQGQGQDRSRYRDYRLGGDLSSISALTGVAQSEVKTLHVRPAMMQELQWRRRYSAGGATPAQIDPVQQIVFSFYNDQLSRMVVDYDHDRTAGMTDLDMIEAISTAYGPRLNPPARAARVGASSLEEESGAALARWGDADYSVVLYRSSYGSGFRIIVTSPRLEALARTADAQAIRLDEREAPQREIARQKKDVEDSRASQEKARTANKADFRP
jgi:hypothetical protein